MDPLYGGPVTNASEADTDEPELTIEYPRLGFDPYSGEVWGVETDDE